MRGQTTTISVETTKVYLAPTRGRRFITLKAAVLAEARAQLDREYNFDATYSDDGRMECPPECWREYVPADDGARYTKETQQLLDDKIKEIMEAYKTKSPLTK